MRKYRKFGPGDKVFAKVRGYPPWPARIVGVADEASQISKMRYHIYFYGTGESAVVKAEDVFLFTEHRNGKLGKPRKLKGFNEAIAEIESELSPEEKEQMSNAESADPADSSILSDDGGTPNTPSRRTSISNKATKTSTAPLETTTEIETSTPTPSISNENSSPAEPKVVKSRKRKSDAIDSDVAEVKKTKSAPPPMEQVTEEESSQSKGAEVVSSRSGRKIKPKKFSDFEDDKDNDESVSSKSSKSPTKVAERAKPAPKTDKKESAPMKSDDDFLVFLLKGENISIPLKTNRPTFKNPKSPIDWDQMVLKQALSIKEDVLSGEVPPEKVTKLIEDWTKEKAVEMKKTFEEEDFKYSVLKVENKLLQLDLRIKSSLTLTKPDPKECLKHLDELLGLQVSAIMLKKHPEVVETIKRMRRYVGNIKAWTISSQDELDVFDAQAQTIRTKSDHIFNKFKSLFVVPPGKTFWSVFSKELENFHKKTQNMSQDKVFGIVKEPF